MKYLMWLFNQLHTPDSTLLTAKTSYESPSSLLDISYCICTILFYVLLQLFPCYIITAIGIPCVLYTAKDSCVSYRQIQYVRSNGAANLGFWNNPVLFFNKKKYDSMAYKGTH